MDVSIISATRQTAARRALKAEYSFEAVIETVASSGRRLVAALEEGAREFVLTASDGTAVRVRIRLASTTRTQHQLGDSLVAVDWANATVECGEHRVTLSRTELRLLAVLITASPAAVSRGELIGRLWPGEGPVVEERENALAVYVCSLRKRLSLVGLKGAIETVRGLGYRMIGWDAVGAAPSGDQGDSRRGEPPSSRDAH